MNLTDFLNEKLLNEERVNLSNIINILSTTPITNFKLSLSILDKFRNHLKNIGKPIDEYKASQLRILKNISDLINNKKDIYELGEYELKDFEEAHELISYINKYGELK